MALTAKHLNDGKFRLSFEIIRVEGAEAVSPHEIFRIILDSWLYGHFKLLSKAQLPWRQGLNKGPKTRRMFILGAGEELKLIGECDWEPKREYLYLTCS